MKTPRFLSLLVLIAVGVALTSPAEPQPSTRVALDETAILKFARQLAKDRTVEANITGQGQDNYTFDTDSDGKINVTAGTARGVLYAVYDVLDGKTSGKESPAFSVRGINPCESFARHTPEMVARLIDRMGRWKMNRIIIHSEYGFERHKELILRECGKRGIDLVYYLYDNVCFGNAVPRTYWAVNHKGKVRAPYDHLEAYDRVCASKTEGFGPYRKGVDSYLAKHTDFRQVMFATADGGDYCQCPECSLKGPWEQVLPFFNMFFDEASDRNRELLVYHERYEVPKDVSRIGKLNGVMYDLHSRNRMSPLTDSGKKTGNRYLYDRLLEWRKVVSGTLYIFENMMIQGDFGVPSYNAEAYLEDLRQFKKDGIDGMIYEVYEPGISPHLPALDVFSKAMWRPFDNFQVTDTADPEFQQFRRLVGNSRSTRNLESLKALNTYLVNLPDRDRFDWLYIGFSSMKRCDAKAKSILLQTSDPQEKLFLETNKIWDFLEKVESLPGDSPREATGKVIEKIVRRLQETTTTNLETKQNRQDPQ
jgi:hypothetical protein